MSWADWQGLEAYKGKPAPKPGRWLWLRRPLCWFYYFGHECVQTDHAINNLNRFVQKSLTCLRCGKVIVLRRLKPEDILQPYHMDSTDGTYF